MTYQNSGVAIGGTGTRTSVGRLSFGPTFMANTVSGGTQIDADAFGIATRSSFRKIFTSTDLDATGTLTFTHALSEDFPFVEVWSNARRKVEPDDIVSIDKNTISVVLSSYQNIAGNWAVCVRK